MPFTSQADSSSARITTLLSMYVCNIEIKLQVLLKSSFQVSSNGFFSFGGAVPYTTPQLFSSTFSDAYLVAPYWASNDISNRVGNISYEVHSSTDYVIQVSTFISQQQQVQFNGSWMLLAEWNNVPQFNGSNKVCDAKC